MANGLFEDDPFGQFMANPMTQLGIALMAAPRRDAQGRGTGLGQQMGSAMGSFQNWQQAIAQMQMQKFQQEQMQRQQQRAQQEEEFRKSLQGPEFRTPEGKLDYEKVSEAGLTQGFMPLDTGLRLQETKENREERLAANRERQIQQAELAREQMAQRGEIARAQIDMRRDIAGMTGAIARQNADTQRMMVESRIADLHRQREVNPFGNAPSYKSGVKVLEDQYKMLPEYDKIDSQLKRWIQLNDNVETGPVAGRLPPQYFNPDFQELEKLESNLAMNNFKPSGQMSNLERGLIVGGGPNRKHYKEANKNNILLMMGATQNGREYLDFQQAWLSARGSLPPASAWQKYLNENPRYLLDAKTRNLIPNPQRKDWASYFGGTAAPPQAPAQNSQEIELERGPDGRLRPKAR